MSTLHSLTLSKQTFIIRNTLGFGVFSLDLQSLTALVLNYTDAVSCIIYFVFQSRQLKNETVVFFLKAWRHFLDSKNSYDGQVQISGTVLQTVAAINGLGFTYRPLNVKEDKDIRITL